MNDTTRLLARLDEIATSLQNSGHALALLGLGSVGLETQRIDAYSDLDFFVIVEEGYKSLYLQSLDWLAAAAPIVYSFQNTVDGYKALFVDDIFCEFAVFEEKELAHIPFAPGRIVWKHPSVSETIALPVYPAGQAGERSQEWLLGEALTNLYVGLGRYQRGEKLSALRLIQVHAVDRVVELAQQIEEASPAFRDPFAPERRFEQHFPQLAQRLPAFMQGYGKSCESALAILGFLETHFEVNAAIAERIRARCVQPPVTA